MSSWFVYTLGPAAGQSPEAIRDALVGAFDERLLSFERHDEARYYGPFVRGEGDCLCARLSTSVIPSEDRLDSFRRALVEWLGTVHDRLDVAYLVEANDTGDWARIHVYRPATDGLEHVEERYGHIYVDREERGPDEFFPERAMLVHPADGRWADPDRSRDHLAELADEYGTRPRLEYS